MKRFISLAVVFAMLFCLGLSFATAEEEKITQDAFVFERLEDGNLKLIEYTDKSSDATINIPSTVDGHQVERIGKLAFSDCKAKNITIPSTVKMIETSAFFNCKGIQKISIPNDVVFVEGNPFTGCSELVNISLDPKHPTLQVTSDGALYSKRNKMLLCYPCSKADSSFTVKEGTLVIGRAAFALCDRLESVTLPETVTEIYEEAFLGCSKLGKISLPKSLLKIGDDAFSACSALASIVIPENVARIDEGTFALCEGLKSVSLPQNMTDINDEAFYGCSALEKVKLPKNLSTIGEKAFAGCTVLKDVDVPFTVTHIGDDAFEDCSVQLYLHLAEYSYAEIYAKIYNISYTYDTEDDFLKTESI